MPGVQLTANGGGDAFGYASRDRARLDSVLAVVTRRQDALRAASEAERRATEATAAASRRAIHHLVQRGEALEFIARRYGVPVDSLVKWNALTSTRIAAGRRLLVKPGTE
ncbi:MAG TPA: LysM peptidoglycan-binding domain-containing protein, partial [Gemmatimonadaceae bacterium]|nr:LysM peptidoglycan-binding domain-containing protein [Gemmatimonadaceae bacterium]